MEGRFKPSPNMVTLYRLYVLIVVAPIALVGCVITWIVYISSPDLTWVPALLFSIPIIAVVAFLSCWIGRYFQSINYQLTNDEVIVERGVWWKMKHTVPFARIMSVDVIQGPISRMLGIATVDVYTAGYTGVRGGAGGPVSRRAEASIMHVPNFGEVRESVLSKVRSRPLFAAWSGDAGVEMLSELRKIRELLQK